MGASNVFPTSVTSARHTPPSRGKGMSRYFGWIGADIRQAKTYVLGAGTRVDSILAVAAVVDHSCCLLYTSNNEIRINKLQQREEQLRFSDYNENNEEEERRRTRKRTQKRE